MNLKEFLNKCGFKQVSDYKYTLDLADYTIEAYINGKGIIFHVKFKDGNELCTIQQDDYESIGDAFIMLMKKVLRILGLNNNSFDKYLSNNNN